MRIPGEESQSPRPRTRGRSAGTDQFDWVYREQDYAAFTTTIHPDVAGRPQVLMALERVIAHIKGHDGVRWVTFGEIAQDFLRRSPRPA